MRLDRQDSSAGSNPQLPKEMEPLRALEDARFRNEPRNRHASRRVPSVTMILIRMITQWAGRLSRRAKAVIVLSADAVSAPLALFVALSLKAGSLSHIYVVGYWPYVAAVLTAIPLLAALGLYRAVVRHVGTRTNQTIFIGVAGSAAALTALDFAMVPRSIPLSALGIYWALALIFMTGSRAAARVLFRRQGRKSRERVAIYGAGKAGTQLAAMMLAGSNFEPVAFVDDKRALVSRQINGLTVYPTASLQQLIESRGVQRILLAMPAVTRRRRHEILASLEDLNVHVQSVPELTDVISGRSRIDDLREVDVNDLLGRDAVPPIPALFRSCIAGKSVMVTGAGGSIGSELCRQIVTLAPQRIVLFEQSELALYSIDQELRKVIVREGLQTELVPLLGSVHHRQRVRDAIFALGVQTVYHAAAYKHVPIVEHNMIEGLHNNVIGTWYAAESAMDAGVETFVLISTDKAVNPTNVMGATKRFAELVLQGLQSRATTTRFCMVRFGNVLDSSGSVVPLFREQIRNGGPVTVTHPEVTRFFMTIPEAAQLVIQAGAMGTGGDVFVLDMGQSVRIADLARRMIHLTGLSVRDATNPTGDIEIAFTGLRTAEKLYEELLIGSNVTGTEHSRIMRAVEHSLPWARVQELLDDLLIALANYDCQRASARLSDAVREYTPTGEIPDHIWQRRLAIRPALNAKVTAISRRKTDDSAAH
jgi:FlaA1/EpsC-like NDP-sugar epimerase